MWENIQNHCNESQTNLKENLRFVYLLACFCLPNQQRIWRGKIILTGGKMVLSQTTAGGNVNWYKLSESLVLCI